MINQSLDKDNQKKNDRKYSVSLFVLSGIVIVASSMIGIRSFKQYSYKKESLERIEKINPQLEKSWEEMLSLYAQRIDLLLEWESSAVKSLGKRSPELALNETVKAARDLNV